MVRAWTILLGIGLFILGALGINTPGSVWMGWLDIIGGMISFYVGAVSSIAAASHSTGSRLYSNIGGVLFLCLGLVAMWIAGLVTGSLSSALAWWNFGFACVYGLLTIRSARIRGGVTQVPFSTEEREQQRSGRAA